MEMLLSWLSGISLLLGTAALIVGALGLVRLPNLFSRIHAVGMMDTAGVAFITLGMLIHEGFSLISVKLAVVGVFLFFTSPIATHAVAQVAHRSGFSPVTPVKEPRRAQKAAKKAAAKKTANKAASGTPVEKAATKKAVAKKAVAKKAVTDTAAGKKTAGKRTVGKKAVTKKTAGKKTAGKKTAGKTRAS
jgi:multicomponent Na+:H+ antiporter subunit G